MYLGASNNNNNKKNKEQEVSNNAAKNKFMASLTTFVDALSGAQQSLNDVVKLSECDQYDLSKLISPAMYQAAASSTETLELIENHTKLWIKEIEQVPMIIVSFLICLTFFMRIFFETFTKAFFHER